MSASDPRQVALRARKAASAVASLPTRTKNAVLRALADAIGRDQRRILHASERDMTAAQRAGLPEPKLRRLALTRASLEQMRDGLRQVAELPDPVGLVTQRRKAPSGLRVRKVRAPLGVILMIYEARPNVTIDAFALCFKAGNACLLKGGSEAARSNEALAELARAALSEFGAPKDAITLVAPGERDALREFLALSDLIDLVIPRGGASLIEFVREHSRIPTVQHFHGVCHIFVDVSADLERALDVVATAKTGAPATCNALECALVHEGVADRFIPALAERLTREGVEIRGDARVCAVAPSASPARDEDWGHEFLDLVLAVRVVANLEEAIGHIQRFGSAHTDAILTRDHAAADEFTRRVHSSCVLVNASTRFNDGYQLGLGAEIGISTSRIHAFGPMGLEELTTQRWIAEGDWHTR